MRSTCARLLAVSLCLLLVACTSRPGPPAGTPSVGAPSPASPSASPGEGFAGPSLAQMLDEVAALRGLAAPPNLQVRFVARSELPRLMEDLLTEEDLRWFAETTTLYRLLGHLRPDQDYLEIYRSFSAAAVLGLYAPDHDALWIVRDGSGEPPPTLDDLSPDERETLAHELVHALQDFHFDLGATFRRLVANLDRNLAWTAVVEGDAVYHSEQYRLRALRLPGTRLLAVVRSLPQQLDEVPPAILRELYFPYTTGAEWVRYVVEEWGRDRLDDFLREPPFGTSVVLHRELAGRGWRPELVPEPGPRAALGPEWRRESGGQFGEFSLRNFFQHRLSPADASAAAGGWAGDAYAVYSDGRRHLALFDIRFETADDGEEAERALAEVLAGEGGRTSAFGLVSLTALPDGREVAALRRSRQLMIVVADERGLALPVLQALAPD